MTARSRADARGYLASLEVFGIKLGLATMQQICARLGRPDHAWTPILIGGTNGKGSVAAMVDEALRAAGHRTGCYTSPHLVHLEERVRVDGATVPPNGLDAAVLRVRSAVAELQAEGALDVQPTFFEVTTAAAFDVFRAAGVQLGVLEVGLGGRFDATNVVAPRAAAITSVALDHEQHLGGTLEAIAFEKAGIVRPGRAIVIGPLPPPARAVVAAVAAERNAPLIDAERDCEVRARRDRGLTVLSATTPVRRYEEVTLSLRGDHQIDNALVAIRLLETLDGPGLAIGADAIRQGLERARWPARLDLIACPGGRQMLLDGAHNPAGAAALARYVGAEWPRGLPVVFGAMRDKQLAGMLRELRAVTRLLVLTQAPGHRGASLDELLAAARTAGHLDIRLEADVARAMEHAWAAGDPIIVAGSLYLAGRALELTRRG